MRLDFASYAFIVLLLLRNTSSKVYTQMLTYIIFSFFLPLNFPSTWCVCVRTCYMVCMPFGWDQDLFFFQCHKYPHLQILITKEKETKGLPEQLIVMAKTLIISSCTISSRMENFTQHNNIWKNSGNTCNKCCAFNRPYQFYTLQFFMKKQKAVKKYSWSSALWTSTSNSGLKIRAYVLKKKVWPHNRP